jgi:hypothetical protein
MHPGASAERVRPTHSMADRIHGLPFPGADIRAGAPQERKAAEAQHRRQRRVRSSWHRVRRWADERLRLTPDGRVVLDLRHRWSGWHDASGVRATGTAGAAGRFDAAAADQPIVDDLFAPFASGRPCAIELRAWTRAALLTTVAWVRGHRGGLRRQQAPPACAGRRMTWDCHGTRRRGQPQPRVRVGR